MTLDEARRAFAEELRAMAHVGDSRVVDAFAEAAAIAGVQADFAGRAALKSLRRDAHEREDTCWLHGAGWCLSKRELH